MPPKSKPEILPFKTPRQLQGKRKAKVQQDVVDVSETDTQEKETPVRVVGHRKDNSEWGKRMEKTLAEIETRQERQTETETIIENPYPNGTYIMSEREATETAMFGEVLRWSSESEGETEKTTSADKKKTPRVDKDKITRADMSNTIVLITETEELEALVKETDATFKDKEESDSDDDNIPVSQILAMKTTKKTPVPMLLTGEACIGHMILKKFETGLFKGTVTRATKQRGRFMYHILYEDGDSEDMNDKELLEGHEMYNRQTETTFQTSTYIESEDNAASDNEKSGGETEGSDYQDSDVEEQNKRKKKENWRVENRKSN
jgi:hypothetical protein